MYPRAANAVDQRVYLRDGTNRITYQPRLNVGGTVLY